MVTSPMRERAPTVGSESNNSTASVDAEVDLGRTPAARADKALSIDDFQVLSKLGEGGFGTVLLVRKKNNGKLYALKVLVKKNMTKLGDAQRAISESIAMQDLKHPFIVQLHYAFQDKRHVYFVLEFVGGGDLFSHLERGIFPEAWCKVYVAEIALAIAHVHAHDFVYRDLKPENVLVQCDGHLVLADFGLAKKIQSRQTGKRLNTLIGTPSLLAPEQFLEKDYGASIDWWALGLLFCEMLMGETLIVDHGEDNLHALIESYRSETHLRPMPSWVSKEAADLIRRLLSVSRHRRMCCGPRGFDELKAHPFFSGLDWDKLFRKELDAPLRPFAMTARTREHTRAAEAASIMSRELSELDHNFVDFSNGEEDLAASAPSAWSSALCSAAAAGDLEQLRSLLSNGAPVDVGDYDDRTAMHLVASEGNVDVLRFLVEEARAAINPVDRWGGTPLDDAIRQKHGHVVQYLLGKGASKGTVHAEANSADLCDAAANGDVDRLRKLVQRGVSVNDGDYDKRTALHLAASEGLLDVVKFLVEEAGASYSPVDRWGSTPLDEAIRASHAPVEAYLSDIGGLRGRGPNGDARQGTARAAAAKSTDLCDAAANGDIAELRRLVVDVDGYAGPSAGVNEGDYDKRTPIHLAASEGLLDVVKFLVEEARADHSPVDRWGGTPLDDAIRAKHVDVARYLTEIGATTGPQGARPVLSSDLCGAAAHGDVPELRTLVARGANVNLGDYDKRTALHLAASEGLLDVVKFLVEEAGASYSPVDRWGGTPLDDAARHGHADVVEYLSDLGACTSRSLVDEALGGAAASERGMDLCEAAFAGHLTVLRVLVAQGADPNRGDYDKRTALHLAAAEGHSDVVKYLVEEAKAKHSPRDRWGGTPLDDAMRSKHARVADYLRARGAGRGRGRRASLAVQLGGGGAEGPGLRPQLPPRAHTAGEGCGDEDGAEATLGDDSQRRSGESTSDDATSEPRVGASGQSDDDAQSHLTALSERPSEEGVSCGSPPAGSLPLPRVVKRADRFECPLCAKRFVDPVVADDGYTYERAAVEAWFADHGPFSPMTHERLGSRRLVANATLRELIEISHPGTGTGARSRSRSPSPPPKALFLAGIGAGAPQAPAQRLVVAMSPPRPAVPQPRAVPVNARNARESGGLTCASGSGGLVYPVPASAAGSPPPGPLSPALAASPPGLGPAAPRARTAWPVGSLGAMPLGAAVGAGLQPQDSTGCTGHGADPLPAALAGAGRQPQPQPARPVCGPAGGLDLQQAAQPYTHGREGPGEANCSLVGRGDGEPQDGGGYSTNGWRATGPGAEPNAHAAATGCTSDGATTGRDSWIANGARPSALGAANEARKAQGQAQMAKRGPGWQWPLAGLVNGPRKADHVARTQPSAEKPGVRSSF